MGTSDGWAYTAGPGVAGAWLGGVGVAQSFACARGLPAIPIHHLEGHLLSPLLADPAPDFPFVALLVSGGHTQVMRVDRSEEHTSELQSLMRISYAVFCLNKQKTPT